MMAEWNEFFEQLRRGDSPESYSLYDKLHRIPSEPGRAARQAQLLIDHAVDEIFEVVRTVGNIVRWHGSEQILGKLPNGYQDLLQTMKEISLDEPSDE